MKDIADENRQITRKVRIIARELLSNGEVDVIIGYAEGTFPLSSCPTFIRKVEEVDQLIWNNLCYINLATYLTSNLRKFLNDTESDEDFKVGIVAKGCVARAINQLSLENQFDINQLRIIGIECNGIINRRRIEKEIGPNEITNISINGNEILVECNDFQKTFPFEDYLNELCKACQIKSPPQSAEISNIIYGTSQDVSNLEMVFDDILEFEEKNPDEKWEEISDLLQLCTRCYACREVCPFCYCNLCFIDQNMPNWFGKTIELPEIITFHLIRAMHLAGRCVGCGSCSSVCPVGIDLSLINRKIEKIGNERFDFISGLNLTNKPPMTTHSTSDKQDFMLEEKG
ncbi:MAG: hypothetical protein GF311_07470 [Candidatus Lokiarchaeota archaeon]|jgi:ferredoxin|nr:hypothetical protein [Candidatus Lokiarchaeota archaeon]